MDAADARAASSAIAGVDAHAQTRPAATRARRRPASRCRSPATKRSFRALARARHTVPAAHRRRAADASEHSSRAIRQRTPLLAVDRPARRRRRSSSAPTNARGTAHGATIVADGPVTLRVRSNAPAGFTTSRLERDRRVLSGDRADVRGHGRRTSEPAVYRVEIRASGSAGSLTWLVSNPIYVAGARSGAASRPPRRPPRAGQRRSSTGTPPPAGGTEHDPTSLAARRASRRRVERRRAALPLRPVRRSRSGSVRGARPSTMPADADRRPIASRSRRAPSGRCASPCSARRAKAVAPIAGSDPSTSTSRSREHIGHFDDMRPVGTTRSAAAPASARCRSLCSSWTRPTTKPGASGRHLDQTGDARTEQVRQVRPAYSPDFTSRLDGLYVLTVSTMYSRGRAEQDVRRPAPRASAAATPPAPSAPNSAERRPVDDREHDADADPVRARRAGRSSRRRERRAAS